jgi:hypothetical protein
MKYSDSTKNIISAFVKAQANFESAKKTANNPFFKSKYADLSEVIDAVKKPLSDNGLAFVQTVEPIGNTYVLKTVLFHSSGESLSSEYPIFAKSGDAQGFGAGVTYARRYALQTLLGIPADDDDGNTASANNTNKTTTQKTQTKPASITQQSGGTAPIASIEDIKKINGVSVEETDTKIVVSGKTFNLSNDLRALKFSWDGKTKSWSKEINKLPLDTETKEAVNE